MQPNKYSREEIINDTITLFEILLDSIEKGKIQDTKGYIVNAHTALNQLKFIDAEEARCLEALKNSLVSEGTMLLMPKGGRGSLARRPKPPTQPTVS